MKRFTVRKATLWGSLAALNVISNLLANITVAGGWLWILIALGVGIIAVVIYFMVKPNRIIVKFEQAVPLREDRERYAKPGLIVLLSDFVGQGLTNKTLSPVQLADALDRKDHNLLDLEHSNQATVIHSVMAHQAKLQHCWILTTSNSDGTRNQSLPFAPVMEACLKEKYGLTCQFHYGKEFTVPVDDDDAITRKLRDIISEIFKTAKKEYHLNDEQIVADITGGLKSMSLGMILACLDKQRTLQYVGSKYAADGKRMGDPIPMLFDFEPEFIEG